MTRKKVKAFVSFAMADKPFADSLVRGLKGLGVSTFGVSGVGLGDGFAGALMQPLKQSDFFVFVVPSHEGAGRWALAELGAAKALDKRIFAVAPDRTRFRNGDSLRPLFTHQILDASTLSGERVAERILESADLAPAA